MHARMRLYFSMLVAASCVLVACSDDASPSGEGGSGSSSTQSGTAGEGSDASGGVTTTGTTGGAEDGSMETGSEAGSDGETGGTQPADTRIAFIRQVGGGYQAFVAEADGSGEVQITDGNTSTLGVAWAPDGRHLAVTDGAVLRVIEDDGANPFDVMLPEPGIQVFRASWAPDNETLVFDASGDIYSTIAEPGSTPTAILTLNVNSSPEWSPDGASLVYSRGLGMPAFEQDGVYLMDADGSNERIVTEVEVGQFTDATWLRDGQTLVFNDRDANGISQIYAVQSDGSDRRALTDEPFDVVGARRCSEADCVYVIEFGEGIDNGAYRLDTNTGTLTLAVPDAILVVTVP